MKARESSLRSHQRIAVVGAGVAGLTAARELQRAGLEVRVFDKARGPGGRISTRRAGELAFDHGAQYFTARSAELQRELDVWQRAGVVAPWKGRIVSLECDGRVQPGGEDTQRYVGTPSMSAIARHLAEGLDVVTGTRVESVRRIDERWHLRDADGAGLGRFDALIVALPAGQALDLVRGDLPILRRAREVRFGSCFAAMIAFEGRYDVDFDGAFLAPGPVGAPNSSVLSWVARNSNKPGRPGPESWVLHGDPEWTELHLGDDSEEIVDRMVAALERRTGVAAPPRTHSALHYWRYAQASPSLDEGALFDEETRLALAGDWCHGSRVEGAYLSGLAAARRLSPDTSSVDSRSSHPRHAG